MRQMAPDDADVVARAQDGDTEAFRALVERHARDLFRVAYRITGSEPDAEDVVQETFLRAYGDRESRHDAGAPDPSGWRAGAQPARRSRRMPLSWPPTSTARLIR